MQHKRNLRSLIAALLLSTSVVAACGGGDGGPSGSTVDKPTAISSFGANVVDQWNKLGADTILQPAASSGTPEERMPVHDLDMATLNIAMYDALAAITGTYQPFMATITQDAALSSMSPELAVHGAAYTVLSTLFPARSVTYKAFYDAAVAGADAGGMASAQFGSGVARQVLALRSNDGRWTPLAAYVPGSAPGEFRGTNPVNRARPSVRPFFLRSADQFRPSGPPALASAEYTADLLETKSMGTAASSPRTESQTENARFHTEPPPLFWTRNFRQFATSRPTLVDNARLMAMLWATQADATTACFEAKYHFNFWRPTSAIRLADTDGNPATEPDAQWAPIVPTPNHPEYPAAHACLAGAFAAVLERAFGTKQITFSLTSTVTGSTHTFNSTEEMVRSIQDARVDGGMHFRTSTQHGASLGQSVTQAANGRFLAINP